MWHKGVEWILLDCCHLLIMRSRRCKDDINNFAHLLIIRSTWNNPDYLFAENVLTCTRCKRRSVKYPVVSVVVKIKAQRIIDKSERLVETRYCLTGSRMGTTYPRASPPVTTALPPYGQWVQGQISLSTALQAGRLLIPGWSRRGTALQADPCEWMYVGGWCERE